MGAYKGEEAAAAAAMQAGRKAKRTSAAVNDWLDERAGGKKQLLAAFTKPAAEKTMPPKQMRLVLGLGDRNGRGKWWPNQEKCIAAALQLGAKIREKPKGIAKPKAKPKAVTKPAGCWWKANGYKKGAHTGITIANSEIGGCHASEGYAMRDRTSQRTSTMPVLAVDCWVAATLASDEAEGEEEDGLEEPIESLLATIDNKYLKYLYKLVEDSGDFEPGDDGTFSVPAEVVCDWLEASGTNIGRAAVEEVDPAQWTEDQLQQACNLLNQMCLKCIADGIQDAESVTATFAQWCTERVHTPQSTGPPPAIRKTAGTLVPAKHRRLVHFPMSVAEQAYVQAKEGLEAKEIVAFTYKAACALSVNVHASIQNEPVIVASLIHAHLSGAEDLTGLPDEKHMRALSVSQRVAAFVIWASAQRRNDGRGSSSAFDATGSPHHASSEANTLAMVAICTQSGKQEEKIGDASSEGTSFETRNMVVVQASPKHLGELKTLVTLAETKPFKDLRTGVRNAPANIKQLVTNELIKKDSAGMAARTQFAPTYHTVDIIRTRFHYGMLKEVRGSSLYMNSPPFNAAAKKVMYRQYAELRPAHLLGYKDSTKKDASALSFLDNPVVAEGIAGQDSVGTSNPGLIFLQIMTLFRKIHRISNTYEEDESENVLDELSYRIIRASNEGLTWTQIGDTLWTPIMQEANQRHIDDMKSGQMRGFPADLVNDESRHVKELDRVQARTPKLVARTTKQRVRKQPLAAAEEEKKGGKGDRGGRGARGGRGGAKKKAAAAAKAKAEAEEVDDDEEEDTRFKPTGKFKSKKFHIIKSESKDEMKATGKSLCTHFYSKRGCKFADDDCHFLHHDPQ